MRVFWVRCKTCKTLIDEDFTADEIMDMEACPMTERRCAKCNKWQKRDGWEWAEVSWTSKPRES